MKLHSAIRSICLLTSMSCLALAYVLAGYWPALFAISAMLLFWIAMKKWSAFWIASGLLSVYLLLAVIGILLKGSLVLVAPGCISAIAWWDLVDFGQSPVGDKSLTAGTLLEKHRLQSLAIMAGVSLLLEAIALWLRLQLPFGAIVLLVLLVTGCITYGTRRLRDSATPVEGQY